MVDLKTAIKELLRDVETFARGGTGLTLRNYQKDVAQAIVDSIAGCKGMTFVVIFPRQSGKNELQAQIESYLLILCSQRGAEIVKASPTWKPQTLNAMRRLERVLAKNSLTRGRWVKESGYIYRIGMARIFFLSGGPSSNVVGATADTLLECDEAQDVLIHKWDKDFAPMAASTNATRVFWGTCWTSKTLLARERRAAEEAQRADGQRRVFVLAAEDVAKEVPAYGRFVAEQVAKLGRGHPLVKTQFFSEEIDAEGGMFPPERLRLMAGSHAEQILPVVGEIYAITIDVAGEDEAATDGSDLEAGDNGRRNASRNPGRDATALTVYQVRIDELTRQPLYKVVARESWTGYKQTRLYGLLRSYIDTWDPRYVCIDATGVGAGLASFLEKIYGSAENKLSPGKVVQFVFTQKSKSDLGWDFLAIIETGRYKDYAPADPEFWRQARACQSMVLEGPGKLMRWSVPDGTRDPETGELVHDDLLVSAALIAALDDREWSVSGPPVVVPGRDPLKDIDLEGF
jgi:hypothetical protein